MKRKTPQPIVFDPKSIIENAIKKNKKEEIESKKKVYDIISFSKEILEQKPFPVQELILKFFYAGSRYNEHLRIDRNDIELLNSFQFPQPWLTEGPDSKIKALERHILNFEKDPANNYFRELFLVMGRRSGKSWMSATIAVYEAYKLLSLYDPMKTFGIDSDIWIINTATNEEQSETIIFNSISKFLKKTPILESRIAKFSEDTITLFSDADIDRNKRAKEAGINSVSKGSVVLSSGSSNAQGLRGHSSTAILMDEFAHYVDASKKSSAKAVYNALTPSASNFYKFGEGRSIVISSPASAEGFFYDHFQNSKTMHNVLCFQIGTINCNTNYVTKKQDENGNEVIVNLLEEEMKADPENYLQEYAAQFKPKSSSQYFPANLVSEATTKRKNWTMQDRGRGPIEYYLHIDPAKNTDRFAVLIAHSENRFSQETRTSLQYIVEDYSIAFKAPVGGYLDPDDIIDNYVLPLFKKFKIAHVSSDAFFSLEQQKKFKNRGIRFKEIAYNGIMKNKIYENLKEYFINGRLELCNDDTELAGELNNIVIDAEKSPPRFSVSAENKEFPNDDLVDCLGGVVYCLLQGSSGLTRLPRTITANINWNGR